MTRASPTTSVIVRPSIPPSLLITLVFTLHTCLRYAPVWSNFEIGDLDFWRGSVYTAFFNYLDSHGGFYYEVRHPSLFISLSHGLVRQRWGDAPVHSIGAALFGGTDKIHFFNEIGYEHPPFTHCPMEEDMWRLGRCTCDPANSAGASFSFGVVLLADVQDHRHRL
jgi:hypothetical protein